MRCATGISSCSALRRRSRCCPAWTAGLPLELDADRVAVSPHPIRLAMAASRVAVSRRRSRPAASLVAARPRIDIIVQQFVSPFRSDRSVVAIVPGSRLRRAIGNAAAGSAQRSGLWRRGACARRTLSVLPRRQPDRIARRSSTGSTRRSSGCSSTISSCPHLWCCSRSSSSSRSGAPPNVWRRGASPIADRAAAAVATCSPLAAQTREGVDILLSKARSLEARGRMDLAARNWNQVLPGQPRPDRSTGRSRAPREAERRHRGVAPRISNASARSIQPTPPSTRSKRRAC